MRVGVLGIDLHGAPQVRDGLVQLVAGAEQHAQIELRIAVLGVELNGTAKLPFGFVGLSASQHQVAQVEVDAIVVRLQPHRLARDLPTDRHRPDPARGTRHDP
jgi:hypothetical protein